jgi:alkanesulfonate monooxygenase SsuD/methylene tetrahydromethanopterin reductase-like flavin-dependent oxidoreductase (luciferase family)
VKFGVLTLPNVHWDELRRRWRHLDELGVDTIWVADHLANPYRREQLWLDGWVAATELARVTEHARIGTLVSPMTFRNPASLAKAAASLDLLAGGRLELGLGSGGSAIDHELSGAPDLEAAERADRFDEFAARVHATLEDTRLEPRRAVPLTIGGTSPRTIRLAAALASRWNSWGADGVKSHDDAVTAVTRQVRRLEAACRETGRTVVRSLLVWPQWLAERPFRSEASFRGTVARWEAVGVDELVFYYPPELGLAGPERGVEPGLFERMLAKG